MKPRDDDPRADEGLVEAMARAIWISSSGGQFASWESLDVFTRGGIKQDARAALAVARSYGGATPEMEICPNCDGSGVGVADSVCSLCAGSGGVPL